MENSICYFIRKVFYFPCPSAVIGSVIFPFVGWLLVRWSVMSVALSVSHVGNQSAIASIGALLHLNLTNEYGTPCSRATLSIQTNDDE